jgi:hypothetical protein
MFMFSQQLESAPLLPASRVFTPEPGQTLARVCLYAARHIPPPSSSSSPAAAAATAAFSQEFANSLEFAYNASAIAAEDVGEEGGGMGGVTLCRGNGRSSAAAAAAPVFCMVSCGKNEVYICVCVLYIYNHI